MRARGTVRWFSGDRGYGFIAVAGSPDVFVQWTKVRGGHTLAAGQRVDFRVTQSLCGPEADDVHLVGG